MSPGPNISGFSNLPVRLIRVIGRDAAIGHLADVLHQRRLLTVVGPGGIGKSTVALAVAERWVEDGTDAVHFIDLSLAYDAASVDAQLGRVLQLGNEAAATRDAILERLKPAEALLLLDNCEHVIADIAELVERIGIEAPAVRMLATSREPLGVPGEKIYRLPSLAVPPRDEDTLSFEEALEFPAAQLLLERAASSGFVAGEDDVEAIVDICHRLDGIPLALELAAGRVMLFGMKELSARLDDRFELLVGARRTAVPRQQTLLATLDWSFSALTGEEQQVLTCLAVFRSAFSLADAIELFGARGIAGGDCVRMITSLVAKSLLVSAAGEDGPRYRLLESTRDYAMQKLGAAPFAREVRLAHIAACEKMVAGARRDMLLLDRVLWMQRYASISVDVQAAIRWAISDHGDRTAALRLATAAAPLIEQLFLSPLSFEPVLALSGDSDEQALRMALPLVHMRGHVQGHVRQMSDYADIADRRQKELGVVMPEVIAAQFGATLVAGDYHKSLELAHTIGQMGVDRDEPELVMLGKRVAAQAHYYLGQFEASKRNALQVIACPYEFLPHSVNNHRVSMRVILSRSALVEDELDAARGWVEEALELGRRDTPITRCLALALGAIPVAVWLDDETLARTLLAEAVDVAERNMLQFWRLTTGDLARAIEHVWGKPPFPPEAPGLEDAIGATSIDTLPTFAPTLLTERALERVKVGSVAWNAAEILRLDALRSFPHDKREAKRKLYAAASLARRHGAWFWLRRIMLSLGRLPADRPAVTHDAAP